MARGSLVSLEAIALASATVTDALVGALHVVMGSVEKLVAAGVSHVGVLLLGSVWVHGGVEENGGAWTGQGVSGVIQITFWGVHVSQTESTGAFRAVSSLPVAVALTHVIVGAVSMAGAGVWALSRSTHKGQGEDDVSKHCEE